MLEHAKLAWLLPKRAQLHHKQARANVPVFGIGTDMAGGGSFDTFPKLLLRNAAQFGAAFVGEAAVGVAASGGAILGDAVAKQVNLHFWMWPWEKTIISVLVCCRQRGMAESTL